MSVANLITALERLKEIYAAGGASAQAKELDLLKDALAQDVELAVETLLAEIDFVSKPKAKKQPKPPKLVNPAILSRFVQALKEAGDVDEVDAVVSIMKHDKIDKDHVYQIAAQFTGSEARFKTIGEAFARIRGSFIEQKRFENKLKAAHLDR